MIGFGHFPFQPVLKKSVVSCNFFLNFVFVVGLLYVSLLPVASLLGDAYFPKAALLKDSFSSASGPPQKFLQSITGLLWSDPEV